MDKKAHHSKYLVRDALSRERCVVKTESAGRLTNVMALGFTVSDSEVHDTTRIVELTPNRSALDISESDELVLVRLDA